MGCCCSSITKIPILQMLYTHDGRKLYYYQVKKDRCCQAENTVFSYDLCDITQSYFQRYKVKPEFVYKKILGWKRFKIKYEHNKPIGLNYEGISYFL